MLVDMLEFDMMMLIYPLFQPSNLSTYPVRIIKNNILQSTEQYIACGE